MGYNPNPRFIGVMFTNWTLTNWGTTLQVVEDFFRENDFFGIREQDVFYDGRRRDQKMKKRGVFLKQR